MDLQQLDVNIDAAGRAVSSVDDALAGVPDPHPLVLEAARRLVKVDEALRAIQRQSTAARMGDLPPVVLPPAPVVDVSILAAFDACLEAGREDWAYFALSMPEQLAIEARGTPDLATMLRGINAHNGSNSSEPADFAQSPRAHLKA